MDDRFSDFSDVVTTLEEVRRVVKDPVAPVLIKEIDHLDELCRDFIARSPFLILGTAGADGHLDMSPKGDPAGFVRVLDDRRLAIPDRPGNRRLDSFQNILENPKVGLIFLIPGTAETLRVRGEARLVRDRSLRESLAEKSKIPEFVVVVAVETVFMHCPKCIIRSSLWQPDSWGTADLPDIGRAMIKHGKLDVSPEELEAMARDEGMLELY